MAKYTIDKEGAPVQIPEELRRKNQTQKTVFHQFLQSGFDPTGTTETRGDCCSTYTPNLSLNLESNIAWSTVSKAAERSSRSRITQQPLSIARKISLCTRTSAVSVLFPCCVLFYKPTEKPHLDYARSHVRLIEMPPLSLCI